MKLYFIISTVIFAVLFSEVQSACPVKEYAKKIFPCHTNIIQSLQKNLQSDCSAEVATYIDCAVKAVTSCYPELTAARIEELLKKGVTKEFFCNNAGLQSQVRGDILDPNAKICSTTYKENTARLNACADKFVKTWRANRADKGLCSEYSIVKECQINVFKTDLACMANDLNNVLDQYYGEYRNHNPFCATGVDSPSSGKPASNPFNPSNSTNSTLNHPINSSSSIATSFAGLLLSLVVLLL